MRKLIELTLLFLLLLSCGRNRSSENIQYVNSVDTYGCNYRLPLGITFHPRYVINNNICRSNFVSGQYVWVYRGRRF